MALLICLCLGFETRAQIEGISIVSAENYYLDKDYRNALIGFEDYLSTVQFDKNVAFKAGICANRLGIGKRAIQHIISAKKAGKKDNYIPFWLGRAYHLDEQWDSSYKYLGEYLDIFPIDKSFKKDAERYMAQVEMAKSMVPKTLQPIIIENMGNGKGLWNWNCKRLLTKACMKFLPCKSRKRTWRGENSLSEIISIG